MRYLNTGANITEASSADDFIQLIKDIKAGHLKIYSVIPLIPFDKAVCSVVLSTNFGVFALDIKGPATRGLVCTHYIPYHDC